jgi:hypothetical protein
MNSSPREVATDRRVSTVATLPLVRPVVLAALDVPDRILPVFDLRERPELPRRTMRPAGGVES